MNLHLMRIDDSNEQKRDDPSQTRCQFYSIIMYLAPKLAAQI